jgi:acyl carrier protein
VDYLGAIRELHANHGVDAFVEAGPRPVLTDCAGETLPAGVALVGPPRGAREAAEILDFLVGGQQDRRPRPSSVVPGDTHPAEGNGHPVRVSPRIEQDREPDVEVGDPVPPQESVPAARLPDRSVLLDELRAIFGEQLAYPDEVLTEDAHLEADLGIASVKKVELLIMLLDRYGLPTPPAELRLRDYNTLGKLIDLMVLLGAGGSGAAMAAD